MDQHALNVLDFSKIKDILNGFASSALGQETIAELYPFTNAYTIRDSLSEVTEMVKLYQSHQAPSFDGIYDVRQPLRKSSLSGAMLDPAEILLIGETVTAARRIRSAAKRSNIDTPRINRYIDRLSIHQEIEDALSRVFDDQKNIRDTASRDLSKIRKSLRNQRTIIVRRLEKLIRGDWRDSLQENYHTLREGRYVLPVDARYQNKVPGIIHDRSSTGTTVFMEPLELVNDSNHLKSLVREEEMEIRRILCQLTELIAASELDLSQNLTLFAHLDFVAAKARFSIRYEMNEPKIKDERVLSLVNARHPLLLIKHGRDNVVPLNLTLESEASGLIITGPNTGGKTVILKTVGVLALMAQSGLHIPADANTELPVFESMGADIGDEQSLEQSLSTFSSHIQTIRNLLDRANSKSLVLLDELGSGTDPAEGGALSCAILEHLQKKNALYLATTHLQELKVFAYKTDGVENGSMEFNLQSLQPTYKFNIGLPGKSNAISIAGRLGLPQEVIERANSTIASEGESPEELLTRLGDELRSASSLRAEAERERSKAYNLKNDSEQRLNKARREAHEVIKRAENKSQNLIKELERRITQLAHQEADYKREWAEKLALVAETSRAALPKSITKEAEKILQKTKDAFKQNQVKPIAKIENKFKQQRNWKWNQLKPGVLVQIEGMSEPGKIISVQPDRKQVEISVSSMTLRMKGELIVAVLQEKPNPAEKLFSQVKVDRPDTIEHKVDIHGMTVEEMTPIIEKYIDQAFLAGVRSVTIVHGHGMGILRRTVRTMLRDNPVVRHINPGMDFEGGTGVTVVQLKSSR